MKYDSLSIERLKEMLAYDPQTGAFTWKMRPYPNSRKRAGDVAGLLKHTGSGSYRYVGLDNRQYLASQLAWFYVHGEWAKGQVGVKNGDPSDLRVDNLVEMKTVSGKFELGTREGRAKYNRAFRDENPGHVRGTQFKYLYGVSIDAYQEMLVAQHGVCAICEKPETAKSSWSKHGEARWLCVDHDHATGAIRGLLCNACNHALGHMHDDPSLLRRAADYLDRHAAKVVAIPKKDSA